MELAYLILLSLFITSTEMCITGNTPTPAPPV